MKIFKLTNKQLNQFSIADLKTFITKVADEIRIQYPEKVWMKTDDELGTDLNKMINRAFAYQVKSETGVRKFIWVEYYLGQNFENNPDYKELKNMLIDKQKSGGEKIDMVFDAVFSL